MFLPTTRKELDACSQNQPDVILVTGDAYIDSPHIGVAVIGKYLQAQGYTVAIIAQPSTEDGRDITRLGEPKLFWGVTAGCIDSMVANYTPAKKWRKQDDYTPGGVNIRPDRASIAYTNLIKRFYKNTRPIVLGGLEASLRRIAHYDFWDNTVRRSLLFDAKADYIAYGMAERTVTGIAAALRDGTEVTGIPGICYIADEAPRGYIRLPSYEAVQSDRRAFMEMSKIFLRHTDPGTAGCAQQHGNKFLVQNPPQPPMTTAELNAVYALDFARDAHPYYKTGEIRALETIKQSITTHRGCFGQCNFCAIAAHQGRGITSRSIASIVDEAERIARQPGFNGIIYDVGGPTANMYAAGCAKGGLPCTDKRCLVPQPCSRLRFGHAEQLRLLRAILKVPGIKKVFISSGIRHDLLLADYQHAHAYINQLVDCHVSGQIKLAPEHYDNEVLSLMGKPSIKSLMRFKALFEDACRTLNKRYFMTYYLMAAHPGCTMDHMARLKDFLKGGLKILPEQVQIFTPTPATLSTAMYYAETDTDGCRIFCEKDPAGRQRQKDLLKRPEHPGFRPATRPPRYARRPRTS
jgi:uncharacterized radical SAM protein YgiQ